MEENEDDILRQLRFTIKSQLGSNFNLRGYNVATVEKDWLLDSICSHEIKPLRGKHLHYESYLV